jgi:hypothetical protein
MKKTWDGSNLGARLGMRVGVCKGVAWTCGIVTVGASGLSTCLATPGAVGRVTSIVGVGEGGIISDGGSVGMTACLAQLHKSIPARKIIKDHLDRKDFESAILHP